MPCSFFSIMLHSFRGDFFMDIATLCQRASISQQTFYRLTRDNQELRSLVKSDRKKRGNGYQYSNDVLKWLLTYYGKGETVEEKRETRESPEEAQEGPTDAPAVEGGEIHDTEVETALRAEIERLRAMLEEERQERQELHRQNAQLLLLLSQEKQEKQLFLPAPKKSLWERLLKK